MSVLRAFRWGVGVGSWARESGVMSVCIVSLDIWCRWQVEASVCCTQCSVAPYQYLLPTVYLSLADIVNPDFLRVVVGPGFVSTSPALMRSSASHPTGPHGWPVKKTVNSKCQVSLGLILLSYFTN